MQIMNHQLLLIYPFSGWFQFLELKGMLLVSGKEHKTISDFFQKVFEAYLTMA